MRSRWDQVYKTVPGSGCSPNWSPKVFTHKTDCKLGEFQSGFEIFIFLYFLSERIVPFWLHYKFHFFFICSFCFYFMLCILLSHFFYRLFSSESPIHTQVYQSLHVCCVIFRMETKRKWGTPASLFPTFICDCHCLVFPSDFVMFSLNSDTEWRLPG